MVNGANGRGERLQIMLSADELMVLDDFRFKLRMPSRASAIRELLKRGLAAEGFEAVAFGFTVYALSGPVKLMMHKFRSQNTPPPAPSLPAT